MNNANAMAHLPGRPTAKAARRAWLVAASAVLGAIATFALQASAAPPLAGATQVTAGDHHACARLASGGVACWGDNHEGQLGVPGQQPSPSALDVPGVADAVHVDAGTSHTCAVLTAGGVKCWGLNDYGQIGDGTMDPAPVAVDVVGLAGMTALKVAAGGNHTCAIVDTGSVSGVVHCWGYNEFGQVGNGTSSFDPVLGPVEVAGISGATDIVAGWAHTCALLSGGAVKCWGNNQVGQLGLGDTTDRNAPADVLLGGTATAIAAGLYHTCAALADGSVACWGDGSAGQLGTAIFGPASTPVAVNGVAGATSVAAGYDHSCAVVADGGVMCWGMSALGADQLAGTGVPVAAQGVSGATQVAAGIRLSCALAGDGVQCWGDNSAGQAGNGFLPYQAIPVDVVGITNAGVIAAGAFHSCSAENGSVNGVRSVTCWGANDQGQLGNGETTPSSLPVDTYDLGALQLAAGGFHACALRSGGVVACWGQNIYGQVGDGSTAGRTTPVNLSISGATQVVAGHEHSCALMADKTVRCWGRNHAGQLGLGDIADRNSPVEVPGLAGVDEIAAGGAHTCARTGGAVKCWGYGRYGQLGNGANTDVTTTPQDVAGLAGATQITAGHGHSCALLGDGSARCWGYNLQGALGDGTFVSSNVPVTVNLAGIAQITAGSGHTCARVSGDTAKCWGGNEYGELGNGIAGAPSEVPVDVVGLATVAKLSAGGGHTCAITWAGTAKCWGFGQQGQLGNGQTGLYGLPATVVIATPGVTTTTWIESTPNVSFHGQAIMLTATVFGGSTPTGTVEFSVDGSVVPACGAVALNASFQAQCPIGPLGVGDHALQAVYSGDLANNASTGTQTHEVSRAPVAVMITGHVPDPSPALSPVTVTVALTVPPPGAGTPTGTVAVSRGVDGCTITLPATSCAFTPTVAGTVAIAAQYGGDANFAPQPAAPVSHTTTALPQAITFPPIPDVALGTGAFVVNATGGDSGNPVVFASATPAVCTVSGNLVSLDTTGLCTLTANQAGNALYAPAPQAIQSFTVGRTNATLALSSSANPSTSGQSVTFTLVASGIAGMPGGTVTFSDGGLSVCIAGPLDAGGSASCTTGVLGNGTHAIAADYSGDAKYLPGTATLAQIVSTAGPPAAYAIADVDYPAASDTEVRALTDNGKLTGLATLAGVPTPFNYASGAFAPLPGGSGFAEVSPWGISGDGTVVGGASDSSASPTAGSGFTLAGSTYSLLARPGWPVTEVRGVNAAGTLVGYSFDPVAPTSVAFIYDPATTTYTDIAPPPGWRRIAHAINAAGQIVGSVDDGTTAQGFLREANGAETSFQVSGLPTYARGINDAGVIAGYVIAGGVAQGFVGNATNGYETLVVPGAVETVPLAINNAGQVAGYWVDSSGKRHGFIATPGQLPVGTTVEGGFQFDVAVVGGQPVFIDPAVAVGYDYAVGAGDPLFVAVRLPIGFGDNQYTVSAGGISMVVAGGDVHDLRAHDSPSGVAAFRVTGIETSAYVDPEDPRGFPTEVTFAASGRFTGTQTPIVVDAPWPSAMTVSATPNPARAGQWIAYAATVTSPGGTPEGTVTFSEGQRTLCTAVLSAGVAQCSGHPLSIGDHAVTARYAGNAEYAAATGALTMSVRTPGGKSAQSISFAPLPERTTVDPPFTVSATASSGLPVAFRSMTSFVCKVSGNVVTLTKVGGACLIVALQGGNASTLPALPVTRMFLVRKSRG